MLIRIRFANTPRPDYYPVLRALHRLQKPGNYLEIGVGTGRSLKHLRRRTLCVGVDPSPKVSPEIEKRCHIERTTSDKFFAGERFQQLFGRNAVDLAFIDGMHLFEYTLRDFINVERHSHEHTLIAVHDLLPTDAAAGSREPGPTGTKWWMGDVWKFLLVLVDRRPDLQISLIDCSPSGIGLISGLDSSNDLLTREYDDLVEKYRPLTFADWEERSRDILPKLMHSPESQRWHKRLERRMTLDHWLAPSLHPVESLHRYQARVSDTAD